MTTATTITYADRPWTKRYDKGIPATLNYPKVPLHQLLVDMAQKKPHDTVMITTAKVPLFGRLSNGLTYAELDRASDAVAAGLIEMGLKKGEAVAIVMPNCAAFGICFFGILKAGGVVAAANPTYPADKMEYQLNDCGARFVFTLTLFYKALKQLQKGTKVEHIIVANIKEYLPFIARILFTIAREKKDGHKLEHLQQGDVWFQDVLKKYAGRKSNVTVTPEDLALFQYTGGTTGVSKAAMSTHRALVANMLQIGAIVNIIGTPPDQHISLAAIPMFHVYGLVAVLSLTVYTGSKMVLVVNAREIEDVVDCIDHYKPTLFPGVPALYNAINNNARILSGKADLSSLKFCISGSAPLPTSTKEEFERLSGAKVREGFGMSEVPTATHVNPIFGENRTNSIGLPLPDVECRIVNLDDGQTDVPVGEAGELIIHAPNMMLGYHGMPTETANVLREKEGKKWMYTGDIARMDDDGYFYIVDRKKDMALIGGYNVYPTNVENIIKSHPAVLEVGVAAVPHPEKEGQEALKAWVVKKPDANVTEQELIKHCEAKLAPYEVPRRIAFIAELPKTVVGKTLRRELIRLEVEAREKK
jgi:long-chain acyl-CoA synthetase